MAWDGDIWSWAHLDPASVVRRTQQVPEVPLFGCCGVRVKGESALRPEETCAACDSSRSGPVRIEVALRALRAVER